jgi:hypothetical protein
MELPLFWLRATFRRRWRSYLGLVILLGITGGLSLFALAGARRTQSAYPRFLRSANVSTMAVDTGKYDPKTVKTIASFPQVEQSQVYVATLVAVLVHGKPDFAQDFESLASLDGRFFDQDRFAPTQGRLPNTQRVDEVAVNETAAKAYGYHVGQKLDLGTVDPSVLTEDSFEHPPPPVLRMTATIVGIGVFPNEVLQDDTDRSPLLLLTPAYTRQALPYVQYEWQGLKLKRGDADVNAVKQRYVKLLDPGSAQFFHVTSVTTYHVEQAVRPLAIALASFAAIAGIASLMLVGQALSRQLHGERDERLALRAMGATPGSSTRTAALGPTIVVVAGSALAVLFAIAASPLMPIGKVRAVEAARGFDADWTVLGFGALTLLVVLCAVAWVSAWRAAPHRQSDSAVAMRPSKVVEMAQNAGLSPAGVAGLRLAMEPGHGHTAVPVRSVMGGVAISVLALVAAVTFGNNLHALVATPRLYGWSWDATLLDNLGYGQGHVDVAQQVFGKDANIDGFAGAFFGTDALDGTNVPLLGVTPGARVHPPILEGRSIESPNEAVLGSRTLAQLHRHIGDAVTIGNGSSTHKLRIVGTATLPTIGIIHGAYTSLGVGAMVDYRLVPGYDRYIQANGYIGPNVWFIRFHAGVDHGAAIKKLQHEMPPVGSDSQSLKYGPPQRPGEIVNAKDIGSSPTLLAGALALAALMSLGLALGSSVRRRRRDLALLKALGFTGRQVGATVRWQAGATVLVGLMVGVPLGVVAGRGLWTLFAKQLDVVPESSTPFVTILVISAVAVVVALIAAALPVRAARRVSPSMVLHSE